MTSVRPSATDAQPGTAQSVRNLTLMTIAATAAARAERPMDVIITRTKTVSLNTDIAPVPVQDKRNQVHLRYAGVAMSAPNLDAAQRHPRFDDCAGKMIPTFGHVDYAAKETIWNEAKIAEIDGPSGQRHKRRFVKRIERAEGATLRALGALRHDDRALVPFGSVDKPLDVSRSVLAITIHDDHKIEAAVARKHVAETGRDGALMSQVAGQVEDFDAVYLRKVAGKLGEIARRFGGAVIDGENDDFGIRRKRAAVYAQA